MHAVHTRQSLMARIVETERRAALARDDARPPRRRQPTFSERYRGTEFDTPRMTISLADAPSLSRGRAFVLVAGTAAIGLCGLIVSAALPS